MVWIVNKEGFVTQQEKVRLVHGCVCLTSSAELLFLDAQGLLILGCLASQVSESRSSGARRKEDKLIM